MKKAWKKLRQPLARSTVVKNVLATVIAGGEGVYITEAKETTIAVDSEGYGMTYLFGDGWVKLADTKQGLLLIEWPAS